MLGLSGVPAAIPMMGIRIEIQTKKVWSFRFIVLSAFKSIILS
jgi:hypothetical protein